MPLGAALGDRRPQPVGRRRWPPIIHYCWHDDPVQLPAVLVDALPLALWRPGNLHLGGRLHFCAKAVRTIESNRVEIGYGRRPFPFADVKRRWPEDDQ